MTRKARVPESRRAVEPTRRQLLAAAARVALAIPAASLASHFADRSASASPVPAPELGIALPDGRFYTETNGGAAGNLGYSVRGVMWHEYSRAGRESTWGPPVSRAYLDAIGRQCQAFQRGIFQLTVQDGRAVKVEWENVFDRLSALGKDPWLESVRQVPPSFDWASDTGLTWAEVVRAHLALLQRNAAIRRAYLADPLWLEKYGLPMATRDFAGVFVIRCQRAVFQQWKTDVPWASAGQVTIALGGDIAKEAGGLIPEVALPLEGLDSLPAPRTDPSLLVDRLARFRNRVGWAYTAVPGASRSAMASDFAAMKALGMNVIYIGHNNPGDANPNKTEPGLSFAVYYAIQNKTPARAGALAMLDAVTAALDAAEDVGIDVVLPIGYQIDMGPEWNHRHPQHLRRAADGSLYDPFRSGPTASPYSEQYRTDIEEYYRWVDATLVRSHPRVIALNLADEPTGGDYSAPAIAAFVARYGRDWASAPAALRGEFQSRVMAEYASWSAGLWQSINPSVRTMMTFQMYRDAPFFPDFEAVFAAVPPTFVFSVDTHIHDGPIDQPITRHDIGTLHGMVRSLAWLSNVYDRPLMLWSSANAWGLGGRATVRGGVAEALANIRIVCDTASEVGGKVGMLMAWGWNIRGQGVYRDEGALSYLDKEDLIRRVSAGLVNRRETLSDPSTSRPKLLLWVSRDALYERVGSQGISDVMYWPIEFSEIDITNRNLIYLRDGLALDRALASGARIEIAYR